MIRVVCAVVEKEVRVLICRRRPTKSLGGYWEFPGGKVNSNESDVQALKRELSEELNMQVEVGALIGSNVHTYGTFEIELVAYSCSLMCWDGTLIDHDAFMWVLPSEIDKYNLAPADIPIAQGLK